MTDTERLDDAYVRIDIDTDEILAFYDGERVERCLKSIWDATVTMHQIATVALKENAKLRECLQDFADAIKNDDGFGVDRGWMLDRMRELGVEVEE